MANAHWGAGAAAARAGEENVGVVGGKAEGEGRPEGERAAVPGNDENERPEVWGKE